MLTSSISACVRNDKNFGHEDVTVEYRHYDALCEAKSALAGDVELLNAPL